MSSSTILVGGRDCSISRLIIALKSSHAFSRLIDKWSSVALSLGTPSLKIRTLRQNLLLDKIGLADLIYSLVAEWVERCASKATLQAFIQVLTSNGLRRSADALEREFCGGKQEEREIIHLPKLTRNHLKDDRIDQLPVQKLLNILRHSEFLPLLQTKWSMIAFALNTPLDTVKKLAQDLDWNKIGVADVIQTILEEWVARLGSKASLHELIHILELNGLASCAEKVREECDPSYYQSWSSSVKNNLSLNITIESDNPDPDSNLEVEQHVQANELEHKEINHETANDLDTHSKTELHRAASNARKSNDLETLKSLIDKGLNVFAKDEENRTFLHILLEKDNTLSPSQLHDMIEYLVSRNYSTLFKTPGWKTDATPLHWAALEIEMEEASLTLLNSNGVDFNEADKLGRSVLFYGVAGERSLKFLFGLIRFGADFRHLDKEGNSLLHSAAKLGNLQVLKFFLNLGLNVNHANGNGDTPLHHVVQVEQADICGKAKLLVENGANVNVLNNEGLTPLAIAVKRKDSVDEMMRLFENLNINLATPDVSI